MSARRSGFDRLRRVPTSTDDRLSLEAWSAEVVKLYASHSRPDGGPLARTIAYPRWAVTVFGRKAAEIGFGNAARLAVDVAAARLRARR